MARIDTVLFDLDDTLCQYERSPADVLAIAFERAGVQPFFEATEYVDRFTEFSQAGDDVRDIRRAAFETFAEEAGRDPDCGRAVAEAFAGERDQSRVEFRAGADQAVESLADAYRLGVVTDGDPWMQSQKIEALGIGDAFETVVHGGHDAPTKPDPEPFGLALEALDATPGSAVHVGDSVASDVRGANNAGLTSVWAPLDPKRPDPSVEPDYRIDSLRDLLDEPWQ
ncbi:HAD family hydrolase [Halapricum hydrolyticum]|uniref:HAD family hydrolase n=1 Tax=Halapricum hydrolyticum TaxID=2979991 RepID=A0AAE3IBM5_9EURY|nr:HAD family hydrolase [Halapricum hydrolyticum]MCU4718505.1 HAD family hydrolase [Halapricum hydrolyticum]MCU4727476.1 HAD family hydrolase [Halapricum hydrolyticum]